MKSIFDNFRQKYLELGSKFPGLKICYYFAVQNAGDNIRENLQLKAEELKEAALSLFPEDEVNVKFFGARSLLDLVWQRPKENA